MYLGNNIFYCAHGRRGSGTNYIGFALRLNQARTAFEKGADMILGAYSNRGHMLMPLLGNKVYFHNFNNAAGIIAIDTESLTTTYGTSQLSAINSYVKLDRTHYLAGYFYSSNGYANQVCLITLNETEDGFTMDTSLNFLSASYNVTITYNTLLKKGCVNNIQGAGGGMGIVQSFSYADGTITIGKALDVERLTTVYTSSYGQCAPSYFLPDGILAATNTGSYLLAEDATKGYIAKTASSALMTNQQSFFMYGNVAIQVYWDAGMPGTFYEAISYENGEFKYSYKGEKYDTGIRNALSAEKIRGLAKTNGDIEEKIEYYTV